MSVEEVEYYAAGAPAGLPSRDSIIQHCAAAVYCHNGVCFKIEGIPQFWVKYGIGITLGEARTQDQVAQIVNADPASVVHVPKVYLVLFVGVGKVLYANGGTSRRVSEICQPTCNAASCRSTGD